MTAKTLPIDWLTYSRLPEIERLRTACGFADAVPTLSQVMDDPTGGGLVVFDRRGYQPLGYLLYRVLLASNLAIVREVGVEPMCRRFGLASQLLRHLLAKVVGAAKVTVAASVPENNLAAQMLLRQQGFQCCRVKPKSHKTEQGDYIDSYIFRYHHDAQKPHQVSQAPQGR